MGSVTPNACSLSAPEAMPGRYFCFCAALPCRSTVPIVYICAWQAAALQPVSWMVSRMAQPADSGRPAPPYSSGISAPR